MIESELIQTSFRYVNIDEVLVRIDSLMMHRSQLSPEALLLFNQLCAISLKLLGNDIKVFHLVMGSQCEILFFVTFVVPDDFDLMLLTVFCSAPFWRYEWRLAVTLLIFKI